MSEPPQVLRIKRKHGEDPLQTLILAGLSKRMRTAKEDPRWFFQLQRTDKVSQDDHVLASVLSVSKQQSDVPQFVIPRKDDGVSSDLAGMVDQYLSLDTSQEQPRKRRGKAPAAAHETSEYVYDVYTLSNTEPLTDANFPKSQIGYIKYFEDDEYDLLNSEDDSSAIVSDDEDSNAESFYQNDYPEDEDAGMFSESHELDDEDYEPDDDSFPESDDDLDAYRDRILRSLQNLIDEP